MAFKNLSLIDFRLLEKGDYPLHPQNILKGKNGIGKSTIKEALCFAFTGADSSGARNPQHLIRFGQKATEVVVQTDKATLSRRLTDKGSVTLKLTINGVATPITQTQLEGSVGTPDVFLSAFIPGFFMEMTAERRHKVLSELLPPVDRKALLEQIAQVQVMPDEVMAFGLSRRVDLVASTIALSRRQGEKTMASLQGEVNGLRSLTPVERPAEPTEASQVSARQALVRQEWDQARRQEKLRLEAEVTALQKQLRASPAEPVLAQEIASDNCPTCGQIVGSKHREKIQGLNAKASEEYQKLVNEIYDSNQKLGGQMQDIRRKVYELDSATTFNGAPAVAYDPFAHHQADETVKAYMNQLARFNLYQEQSAQAETKVRDLQAKIDTLTKTVERYLILEKAVAQIPQAELKQQAELLKMEHTELGMDGSFSVKWHGIDYGLLSKGQRLRCGIELCRKFNSLMKKPLGAIFVDDGEALDGDDAFVHDLQWFVCKVDRSISELSILAPEQRSAMLY